MIDGLTYDDASHTYRMHGVIVPSVTQILAPLSDFSGVAADVMAAASDFGKAVHKVCELHDLRTLDMATVDEPLLPYLQAWNEFCADYQPQWDGIEEIVYHAGLRYAGTLDRRGTFRRADKYVVDIKTTAELYPSVGPQLAGYRAALPGFDRERCGRMAVQLKADGTYAAKIYLDQNDWPVFASLVTLRNWCNKHHITPSFK